MAREELGASHPVSGEVTRLLEAWGGGDSDALGRLIPLVYEDLRTMARHQLGRESPGHTLQPTALVNEVYLRLYRRRSVQWRSREHFFATLAQMMRRILVDHARRKLSAKRGGDEPKISFDELLHLPEVDPQQWIVLDEALEELAQLDPRKSQVVHLRFFIGLTLQETARLLDVSINTVDRDWRHAKMWLRRSLYGDEDSG